MTVTTEDIDTLEVVDFDEIFDEDVPCVYEPECKSPAKWRGYLTCGHQHNFCNQHKGWMMAKMAKGPWPCAVNGAMVTEIKWVEL